MNENFSRFLMQWKTVLSLSSAHRIRETSVLLLRHFDIWGSWTANALKHASLSMNIVLRHETVNKYQERLVYSYRATMQSQPYTRILLHHNPPNNIGHTSSLSLPQCKNPLCGCSEKTHCCSRKLFSHLIHTCCKTKVTSIIC